MKSFTRVAKALLMGILAIAFVFLADSRMAFAAESTYVVNDKEYIFDTESMTITQGNEVYHYSEEGSRFYIVFPNGNSMYLEPYGGGYVGQLKEDLVLDDYPDYHDVTDAAREFLADRQKEEAKKADRISGDKIKELLVIVLICGAAIVLGIFYATKPEKAWEGEVGWQFRNVAPSDEAINGNHVFGIIMIFIGIIGGIIWICAAI